MDEKTLAAVEGAQHRLMVGLAYVGPDLEGAYERALNEAITGNSSIDDLLPFVRSGEFEAETLATTLRGQLEVRWMFLHRVLEVAAEPRDGGIVRDGRAQAKAAAEHLRAAADLLEALDNALAGEALTEMARVVEACAATERLRLIVDSDGIVPGMRAMVLHQPTHRSTTQSAARGKASHRSNVIRHIAQMLDEAAPLSAIARLVEGLIEESCSHADVGQALGRDKTPRGPSGFALQNVWGPSGE